MVQCLRKAAGHGAGELFQRATVSAFRQVFLAAVGQTGDRPEADLRQIGRLEADWRQTGGRLEAD